MESPHDFDPAHWDHEPTPNPSQEGNWRDTDECLLPSWEGSGVSRFMESPHAIFAVHWDHEPVRQPRSFRLAGTKFSVKPACGALKTPP
jgi:hypothetical protein